MSAPTVYMLCFFASNIYSSFTRRGLHVHMNTLQYLCCWKKLSAVYLLCFVHISWCHQWCSKIIYIFMMMVVMKWKYVRFFCVFSVHKCKIIKFWQSNIMHFWTCNSATWCIWTFPLLKTSGTILSNI